MLDMTSCEVPCADGWGQVDKNQHLKFAAMKVKNGINESKKVMMINMVTGLVFGYGSCEYFVNVCEKTASNGKRIGGVQIETVWEKEIVVRAAVFKFP
jgi:hypothetical protein